MNNAFEQVKKVTIEFNDGSASVCTLFGKNNLIFEQLQSELNDAKKEIERLRPFSFVTKIEWQPIETAPKDGTHIIGYIPTDGIYGGVIGIRWRKPYKHKWKDGTETTFVGYWCKSVNKQSVCRPSHWMPLPKLPTN